MTPSVVRARAEARVLAFMKEKGIDELLSGGVLLALSGGADSVFLLHLLARLSAERKFPLRALHVQHHLRGEEADRDAAFCRALAEELGVPFRIVHVDVRAEAAACRTGIEATARRLRYEALAKEAARVPTLGVIATAHHATDHLETVLLRLLRGGGTRALVGIHPVREGRIRPLLCLTRAEIEAALHADGLSYVTDSTNTDEAYARNYVRAELLPRLSRIVPSPERAALRMSEALSHDAELLDELAERALAEAPRVGEGIAADYLRTLPEALRRRVLVRLYEEAREPSAADVAIEHTHILTLSRLLLSGKTAFSVAVPNRLYARLFDGGLSFVRGAATASPLAPVPLRMGEDTPVGDFIVTLSQKGDEIFVSCSSKLYKIDITTAFSSAIISGELYVRGRRPGDSYAFGGHTHSLKKLYNEKRIPIAVRPVLPLFCDAEGIVWMPFCPVRENRRSRSE